MERILARLGAWLAPFAGLILGALALFGVVNRIGRDRAIRRDERNRTEEASRERARQIRDALDASQRRGVRPEDIRYRD